MRPSSESTPRSTLRRLWAQRRSRRARLQSAGTACPRCHSDFMAPIEWEPAGETHWRIVERCGECGVWRELLLGNAQAALLDVRLDHQQSLIAKALDRLDRERMATQIEAFVIALQRDLIGAADFGG